MRDPQPWRAARRVVAAVCVMAALAACAQRAPSARLQPEPTDPVLLAMSERALASPGGRTMAHLRAEDPDAYWTLIRRLSAASDSATAARLGVEAGVAFRRKLARYARAVSDADAKRVLGAYESFVASVAGDRDLCGRLLALGALGMTRRERARHAERLDVLADALFGALRAAKRRGGSATPASDADWARIFTAWSRSAGATRAQIRAVTANDRRRRGYCRGMLGLLSAIRAADGADAERVRADLIYELARA